MDRTARRLEAPAPAPVAPERDSAAVLPAQTPSARPAHPQPAISKPQLAQIPNPKPLSATIPVAQSQAAPAAAPLPQIAQAPAAAHGMMQLPLAEYVDMQMGAQEMGPSEIPLVPQEEAAEAPTMQPASQIPQEIPAELPKMQSQRGKIAEAAQAMDMDVQADAAAVNAEVQQYLAAASPALEPVQEAAAKRENPVSTEATLASAPTVLPNDRVPLKLALPLPKQDPVDQEVAAEPALEGFAAGPASATVQESPAQESAPGPVVSAADAQRHVIPEALLQVVGRGELALSLPDSVVLLNRFCFSQCYFFIYVLFICY